MRLQLMNITIQKWGNSLALRIPKAFADQAGLDNGSRAEIDIDGEVITIRPARREYRLEDMVKKITPANRHEPFDWGPPVGKEVW